MEGIHLVHPSLNLLATVSHIHCALYVDRELLPVPLPIRGWQPGDGARDRDQFANQYVHSPSSLVTKLCLGQHGTQLKDISQPPLQQGHVIKRQPISIV